MMASLGGAGKLRASLKSKIMTLPTFVFGCKGKCTYCGDLANTLDHVIPVSFSTNKRKAYAKAAYGPTTHACRRCNTTLSNKGFDTFLERCEYAHEKLVTKLKPICWSTEELDELDVSLRRFVQQIQAKRTWMFQRADWYETRDFWLGLEPLLWQSCLKRDSIQYNKWLAEYFYSAVEQTKLVLYLR